MNKEGDKFIELNKDLTALVEKYVNLGLEVDDCIVSLIATAILLEISSYKDMEWSPYEVCGTIFFIIYGCIDGFMKDLKDGKHDKKMARKR